MTYQLVNNSWTAKGGYTADHLGDTEGAGETDSYMCTSSDGKTFVIDSVKLTYAGEYVPYLLSFKINDKLVEMRETQLRERGMPVFTLTTTMPTVKITARSNYRTSSNTDTSASVQFGFTEGNGCTSFNNYQQPYVTITLAGYGKAESAALVFTESNNGTVRLYTTNGGSTSTTSYAWSGNGTCQRYVGYYKNVKAGNDDHTVAGTLTANQLKLTSNGKTYYVSISSMYSNTNSITIENYDP